MRITRILFPLFHGEGQTDGRLLFILIIHNGGDINPFLPEDGVRKQRRATLTCRTFAKAQWSNRGRGVLKGGIKWRTHT